MTTTMFAELTGDYVLDATRTRIGFVARMVMVTKVRGQFDDFEGSVHLDGAEPSTGDLTIRGVTRPVTVDLELTGAESDPWGVHRVGFTGGITIDRKDWGVSWNTALEAGGILIGHQLTLELDVAAIRR